jgi:peroxiredoxin-like protein
MNFSHTYNVSLAWKADRQGILSSPELNQSIEVATPPPFPKGMEGIWSPEHLFTAAVNSCIMTTFLAIAENSKLEFESFTCSATGKLEQVEGKYLMTEVTVYPIVSVYKEEDYAKAERILQKSEAACLISNSIKAKVIMEPVVNVLKEV